MSYPDNFTCQDCGRKHQLDTSLPSEIWNRIARPEDVLCVECIDRRAKAAGVTAEVEFYYVGEAIRSRRYSESHGEVDHAAREAYARGFADCRARAAAIADETAWIHPNAWALGPEHNCARPGDAIRKLTPGES
ncbi:MAG TPA: hypothetical protein VF188_16270 [Longimicrobiales bacterium]